MKLNSPVQIGLKCRPGLKTSCKRKLFSNRCEIQRSWVQSSHCPIVFLAPKEYQKTRWPARRALALRKGTFDDIFRLLKRVCIYICSYIEVSLAQAVLSIKFFQQPRWCTFYLTFSLCRNFRPRPPAFYSVQRNLSCFRLL